MKTFLESLGTSGTYGCFTMQRKHFSLFFNSKWQRKGILRKEGWQGVPEYLRSEGLWFS